MPSRSTFTIKPISELLRRYVSSGQWADPFAGPNTIRDIVPGSSVLTNNLNPDSKADCCWDSLCFMQKLRPLSFDGVLYDPPYSVRQVSECYRKYGYQVTQETTRADWWTKHKVEISRILKPGGTVISLAGIVAGWARSLASRLWRFCWCPTGEFIMTRL
jgi:hypothetical protein